MDVKEGVYSKTSVITIGTASTSKKTKSINYYYVKPIDDTKVLVDLLNVNHDPIGIAEEVKIEDFNREYEFVGTLKAFKKSQEKLDPKKVKAEEHVKRGEKHLQNKEYNSAEFEYGTALRYDEENLKAHHGMSKVYLETGKTDKAKEHLKKMGEIEALYDPANKHIFNECAIDLRKQKMYDDAIRNYNKALEIDPNDEVLYYNLARAYFEKGEADNAIKSLEKAIKVNPDFAEAKKALEFIKKKVGK